MPFTSKGSLAGHKSGVHCHGQCLGHCQSHLGLRGPGLFQVTYLQDRRAVRLSRDHNVVFTVREAGAWRKGSACLGSYIQLVAQQVISWALTPHPCSFQPLNEMGNPAATTDL